MGDYCQESHSRELETTLTLGRNLWLLGSPNKSNGVILVRYVYVVGKRRKADKFAHLEGFSISDCLFDVWLNETPIGGLLNLTHIDVLSFVLFVSIKCATRAQMLLSDAPNLPIPVKPLSLWQQSDRQPKCIELADSMIVDGYSFALPTQNRNDNPVYTGLRARIISFEVIYFGFVEST